MTRFKASWQVVKNEILYGHPHHVFGMSFGTSYMITQRFGLSCLLATAGVAIEYGVPAFRNGRTMANNTQLHGGTAAYASAAAAMCLFPSLDTMSSITNLAQHLSWSGRVPKVDYMGAALLSSGWSMMQSSISIMIGSYADMVADVLTAVAKDRWRSRNNMGLK